VRHEVHSYSPLNSFDNVRGDSRGTRVVYCCTCM
jgi:hypothetical protein